MHKELRVGVVGYCPPTIFDEDKARLMIQDAYQKIFEQFSDRSITIVSGLTNVGVLKIAYEEAAHRGWRTVGIACEKAKDYDLYPVSEKVIIGKEWGDESPTFVSSIEAIIRVGGGAQSIKETKQVKSRGNLTLEYNLPAIQISTP